MLAGVQHDGFTVTMKAVTCRRMRKRQGVAKGLLQAAFPLAVAPEVLTITVNASPNSVAAYQSLGFRATTPEQVENGIRFVPMVRHKR